MKRWRGIHKEVWGGGDVISDYNWEVERFDDEVREKESRRCRNQRSREKVKKGGRLLFCQNERVVNERKNKKIIKWLLVLWCMFPVGVDVVVHRATMRVKAGSIHVCVRMSVKQNGENRVKGDKCDTMRKTMDRHWRGTQQETKRPRPREQKTKRCQSA